MFRYIRARKQIERTSLTPEGIVYVIVLAFITVGSVIRNVNLLILMAGIMYAPLFINWRLAIRRLQSFRARRTLPNRIHANKLVSFQWECENILPGVAAYNVMVEDEISRADSQTVSRDDEATDGKQDSLIESWFAEVINRFWQRGSDAGRAHAKVRFRRLIHENPESQSYRVFFSQRGKYVVKRATISTAFPFGLIISRNFIQQEQSFFVAPELGTLKPTWEQRVQSSATGSDSIRRRRSTQDDEFYALRAWRSGDSKKNIHWRTTARLGFPMVKQHDQPNNRDFAIVLDLHLDPDDSDSSIRAETVLSFAATAILEIGRDVQGQVAVAICGKHLEVCRSRTPQGLINDVMPELAVAQPTDSPELESAIIRTADFVSSRTPIYVVSTRSKPSHLELDALSARSEEPDSAAARLQHRRLKTTLPMVRWLDARSEEFQSIFDKAPSSAGPPASVVKEFDELILQSETP